MGAQIILLGTRLTASRQTGLGAQNGGTARVLSDLLHYSA
jgi:hypothetical protein